MSIHDTVEQLSEGTRTAVARLYALHDAGRMDWDGFARLASMSIARDASQAASLAELHVNTEMLRQWGIPEIAEGLNIDYTSKTQSAQKALEDQRETQSYQVDPAESLGYAANDEVMESYHSTSREAMRRKGVGWFNRVADPNACDICRGFADRGPYPVDATPWRHKGCVCLEVPADGPNDRR